MNPLPVSEQVEFSRLIWLCEGLAQIHPDSKEHKAMLSMARGAHRLSMAGEKDLAQHALDALLLYSGDVAYEGESPALNRRVASLRKMMR